jgi:hypothetical protein
MSPILVSAALFRLAGDFLGDRVARGTCRSLGYVPRHPAHAGWSSHLTTERSSRRDLNITSRGEPGWADLTHMSFEKTATPFISTVSAAGRHLKTFELKSLSSEDKIP